VAVLAVLVAAPVGWAAPARAADSTAAITMTGNSAKLSGTKHLKAGWVTFRITSRTGGNNLWFFAAKPGRDVSAAAAVHKPRAQPVAAPESAVATTQRADAAMATKAEQSLVALGGADTTVQRAATVTVELPAGTVYVEDIANSAAVRVATLHVHRGPGRHHPHPNVYISDDGNNSIVAPATLPRTGLLKFGNVARGDRDWHMLEVVRLTDPTTPKSTVARYFASEADNPFTLPDFVGSAPTSGGHAEYVSYSLPAGTYAVVDYWVDSSTGHMHSADSPVAIVELK
jgi:hypothetical protein